MLNYLIIFFLTGVFFLQEFSFSQEFFSTGVIFLTWVFFLTGVLFLSGVLFLTGVFFLTGVCFLSGVFFSSGVFAGYDAGCLSTQKARSSLAQEKYTSEVFGDKIGIKSIYSIPCAVAVGRQCLCENAI